MKPLTLLSLTAGLMLSAAAAHADPTVQVIGTSGNIGDGNLSVAITASGGWGFQITNDSLTDWMGANVSDFCPSTVSTPPCDTNTWLLAGTNPFGPYTDLYGANFVVVAPNSMVTEDYVPGTSGAGSISLTGRNDINVGDTQSGQIIFVYDLYDGDPNAGGNQVAGTGDQFMYANATVTAIGLVPEPSTASLAFAALAFAFLLWQMRRLTRGSALP